MNDVKRLAEEAREFVAKEVASVLAIEPLLQASARDYEFRVKFIGRHETRPRSLLSEVVARLVDEPAISVYAHTPRCPYRCNFCTYAVTTSGDADPDADRLLRELDMFLGTYPIEGNTASSLYFGGGTPTTLSPKAIEQLVGGFVGRFQTTSETEITMEGSPDTISLEKLQTAKNAGVNRFSVGVQTFNKEILKVCERGHSAEQAERAVRMLLDVGFNEVNVDLMRGLPNQTVEGFVADLLRLVQFRPHSIHIYRMRLQRTDELQSRFWSKQNKLAIPTQEEATAMLFIGDQILRGRGYRRMHTAEWTKAETKVFADRWRRQIPLFAFGWRAFSLFPWGEYHNAEKLVDWRSLVDKGELTHERAWSYDTLELELRWTLFKLKMLGLSRAQFAERFGKSLTESWVWPKLQKLLELRVLEEKDGALIFTDRGFLIGEEAIRFLNL